MLNFISAVKDYRYLKNNQYSEKSALALVGNRYQLTKIQRNCLLRGVVNKEIIEKRTAKLVPFQHLKGQKMGIDWYNVLITVEAYSRGLVLFLADDHVLRDCAAVHGSFRKTSSTDKAIRAIFETIIRCKPEMIEIVIDAPVSFSGEMKQELLEILTEKKWLFQAEIKTAKSADYVLKQWGGVVASSDSVIIDAVDKITDLPRIVLEQVYSFHPPFLEEIVFQ